MESQGSQWYLLRMSQRSKKHKRDVGNAGHSGDREWEIEMFKSIEKLWRKWMTKALKILLNKQENSYKWKRGCRICWRLLVNFFIRQKTHTDKLFMYVGNIKCDCEFIRKEMNTSFQKAACLFPRCQDPK